LTLTDHQGQQYSAFCYSVVGKSSTWLWLKSGAFISDSIEQLMPRIALRWVSTKIYSTHV